MLKRLLFVVSVIPVGIVLAFASVFIQLPLMACQYVIGGECPSDSWLATVITAFSEWAEAL